MPKKQDAEEAINRLIGAWGDALAAGVKIGISEDVPLLIGPVIWAYLGPTAERTSNRGKAPT